MTVKPITEAWTNDSGKIFLSQVEAERDEDKRHREKLIGALATAYAATEQCHGPHYSKIYYAGPGGSPPGKSTSFWWEEFVQRLGIYGYTITKKDAE